MCWAWGLPAGGTAMPLWSARAAVGSQPQHALATPNLGALPASAGLRRGWPKVEGRHLGIKPGLGLLPVVQHGHLE